MYNDKHKAEHKTLSSTAPDTLTSFKYLLVFPRVRTKIRKQERRAVCSQSTYFTTPRIIRLVPVPDWGRVIASRPGAMNDSNPNRHLLLVILLSLYYICERKAGKFCTFQQLKQVNFYLSPIPYLSVLYKKKKA